MKGGSQFAKLNGESTATTPQSFVSNIFRFESHAANDQRCVTLPLYLPISEPPQLSIHTDLVTAGDVSLKALGGGVGFVSASISSTFRDTSKAEFKK